MIRVRPGDGRTAAKGDPDMAEKPEKKHLQPPHPFVMIFMAMLCAVVLT